MKEAVERDHDLRPAVVVTGGSQGIGLALAQRFAQSGCDVVLVARDTAKLAEATSRFPPSATKVLSVACDITRTVAYDVIAEQAKASGLYIDVLVNSAGVGLAGPFTTHGADELAHLIALNVEALTRLTRRALQDMLVRKRGGILNVASLGAYVPGPNQAAYYASKSYVQSLSEALASETSGTGVRVAVLLPGPVTTGFHAAMGAENSLYRWLIPPMSPVRVADIAYRNFTAGHRVIVPGIINKMMFVALRLIPHAITVPLIGWLLRR